jgi:hypothetical protein
LHFNVNSLRFLRAIRTQSFEPDLLAMNHKPPADPPDHFHLCINHTPRCPATGTRKVRMALPLRTVMTQFIVRRSVLQIRPVNQPDLDKTLQRPVYRNLIRLSPPQNSANLFRRQWPGCISQNFQYPKPLPGFPQSAPT